MGSTPYQGTLSRVVKLSWPDEAGSSCQLCVHTNEVLSGGSINPPRRSSACVRRCTVRRLHFQLHFPIFLLFKLPLSHRSFHTHAFTLWRKKKVLLVFDRAKLFAQKGFLVPAILKIHGIKDLPQGELRHFTVTERRERNVTYSLFNEKYRK